MYKEALSSLLEMPWGQGLIDDARSKLGNCFGFVNKELVFFHAFNPDGMVVRIFKEGVELPPKEYKEKEVESIDIWTPETGAYRTTSGGVLILIKLPRRQWAKSFKPENYRIIPMERAKKHNYMDVVPESKTNFWITSKGELMLLDIKIGMVDEKTATISCKNLFRQDVEDWIKHGKETNKAV